MNDAPAPSANKMRQLVQAHDWSATALGPMAGWPQSLRTAVDLILASGHAMQLAWGPQRVVIYNDAYAPMLGERHPEALGLPFPDAWPDVWSDIAPLVDRVFVGETITYDELPLVMHRHGYPEETWWHFSYSPVRDESGAVAGLLNVTVDATGKHRADQAERERDAANADLQRNEARFRALVTAGGNSIYRMSADWRLMYQLDSQTLANTAEPIEDWVPKYIPDEDLPGVREAIDAAIRGKALFELEHRVRLADGGIGWVLSRAVPLLGPDGEIVEWFGAVTEVSDRKLAEAALLEADRRKDQFLAVLAHELRNGLAPLVYNVQIGISAPDKPELLQQLLARSGRQLAHLGHLVDDLLDVARISTGKINLQLEALKPRDIVSLALDTCRVDIERKRHRVIVVDESTGELTVRGDRVRLTQVVSNLLSNATKYMDDGGSISVRIAAEGEQAVVEVQDSGIGIPPSALEHVFEMFSQVREQQSYAAGGLGIGLSLVKQLVEMQGGSVAAASEGSGRGSRFTVRLPAVGASENDMPAGTPDTAPGAGGRALRVLVVDDLRDAADSLAELLVLQGHDAETAYGGLEALESVRRRRPDLVFLDLGMPGMDGLEVARHLRGDFPALPAMRIVALTGRGHDTDRAQTRAARFDGHLTKPAGPEELQAVLAASQQLLD